MLQKFEMPKFIKFLKQKFEQILPFEICAACCITFRIAQVL